jgi:transcriptional regulator of arginine metabolism
VASHEGLRRLLAQEGIEATQATISRDLREIGAVKSAAGYTMPSVLVGQVAGHAPDATSAAAARGVQGGHGQARADSSRAALIDSALAAVGLPAALRTFVVSVERGGSMVVARTGPGHASLVAAEIDRAMPTGVLGTVAGDDTIFIACRGESAARRLAAELAQAAGVGSAARGAR